MSNNAVAKVYKMLWELDDRPRQPVSKHEPKRMIKVRPYWGYTGEIGMDDILPEPVHLNYAPIPKFNTCKVHLAPKRIQRHRDRKQLPFIHAVEL